MREEIKDFLWFYKKQVVILFGVLTAVGVMAAAALTVRGKAAGIQQGIAGEILRFHVIANSDSKEDQALKLKVRDAVVEYMKDLLEGAEDLEETKGRVAERLADIEELAMRIVEKEQAGYPVHAELTECYFPRKSYGDCTFPAGRYEALRICIGKAEGKNWWCVLFPNLCFVDSIHAVVPEEQKKELKNVLTEEEYESLFDWKHSEFKITSYLF
mgnify:FL=1